MEDVSLHVRKCDEMMSMQIVLTFEFVVLGVSREKAVGEELGKGESSVLWPVLHVVSNCGLKLLHELR